MQAPFIKSDNENVTTVNRCQSNSVNSFNMVNTCSIEKIPIVPVLHQGYILKSDANSNVAEVNIPATLNGKNVQCLLDSGSDGNLISAEQLNKIIPNWEGVLEDAEGPRFAECAGDVSIQIRGNKWLSLKIGQTEKLVPFCIVAKGSVILIGIGTMKHFGVHMQFGDKGVEIFCNEDRIHSTESQQLPMFSTIKEKIVLKPKQTKIMYVENINILDDERYIVSVIRGPTLAIPSLSTGKNNKVKVVLYNDYHKKVKVKKNQLTLLIKLFDENLDTQKKETMSCNFVKFDCEEKNIGYNQLFYNAKFGGKYKPEVTTDPHTLAALSELDGIEVEKIQFPLKEHEKIIEESFNTCSFEEKEWLKNKLLDKKEIISLHSLDVGVMKNCSGEEILVDIPLKHQVPQSTKVYKLREQEEQQLFEILSYLEFYQIIEPAPVDKGYGVPAFLISRAGSDQKPARLLLDTRMLADIVSYGLSTPSVDIHKPLQRILKSKIVSMFDVRAAYFSLKFGQKTLDTGLTQIATKFGFYRFIRLSMGHNFSPQAFCSILTQQINLDNQGMYNPLEKLELWFDDLICHSDSIEEHQDLLIEFFSRLSRIGLKLSLSKSSAFLKVKTDTFKILGFQISKGQLYPQPSKVEKILKFPTPTTRVTLQRYLGMLNFLRPCLSQKITHLTTELYPLTSPTVKFIWGPNHDKAFKEINNILQVGLAYVAPFEDSVFIFYCDSSEKMFGGMGFSYDIHNTPGFFERKLVEHGEQIPPVSSLYTHLAEYGIKANIIPVITHNTEPHYSRVLKLCYIFTQNFDTNTQIDDVQGLLDSVLNQVFIHGKNLDALFAGRVQEFIDRILLEKFNDNIFFEYSSQILYLIGQQLKMNIKLIIGADRKVLAPIVKINNNYKTDIVLAWCPRLNKFDLLNILEDFQQKNTTIIASKCLQLAHMGSDVILAKFKEDMKSNTCLQNIRLISLYSKSISPSDISAPIHLKETLSILYCADYFSPYILSAPLSVLLTDSKVSVFLFSPKVGESRKRILNYALKLISTYPNLKVLHVSGRDMAADYLSRLGYDKSEFFSKGLSPVSVAKSIRKELEGQILSFTEIHSLIKERPDAVIFSDQKLNSIELDNLYLDMGASNSFNALKGEKPKFQFPFERIEIYNELLSRQNIRKRQLEEFGDNMNCDTIHGLYVVEGKIWLPRSLYVIATYREHFLNLHPGAKKLYSSILNFYYIRDKTELKELTEKVNKGCIGCLLVSVKKDNYVHGIVPLESKNVLISIDLIENLPSTYKYLLVVTDVYTKYCTIYPLHSKKFSGIIGALVNYFATCGRIKFLLSDNYFRSIALKKFCLSQGTTLLNSAAYRSTARSHVESLNFRVQKAIRLLNVRTNMSYEYVLPLAVYLLNNRTLMNSSMTPQILHHGLFPNKTDSTRPNHLSMSGSGVQVDAESIKRVLDEMHLAELEFISDNYNLRKKIQSKKNARRVTHSYLVGDIVLVRKRSILPGVTSKLNYSYLKTPFKIVKQNEHLIFLENLISGIIIYRAAGDLKEVKTVNINQFGELSGSREKFLELFETLDHEALTEDLINLAQGHAEKSGVKTRRMAAEETMSYTQDFILDQYLLNDDNEIGFTGMDE